MTMTRQDHDLDTLTLAPRGELSNGKCPDCEGDGQSPFTSAPGYACPTCDGTGLAEHCTVCGADPGEPCDTYCQWDDR